MKTGSELISVLVLAAAAAHAYCIDPIELPNWWVGMKGKSLQLMGTSARSALVIEVDAPEEK